MPSTYTSRLRLTLPATGELVNTWGATVNTGITELVDASIAGAATISAWGGAGVAYTLSNNNGAADEARCMFIVASGTPGENKNIICPAVSKLYVVKNEVTGGFSVTLKTLAGTGITVPNGSTMLLRCDGTNVVDAITQVSSLTYSGTLTGGTGVVNIGSGQLVKDAAGNLGLGVTPSAWSGTTSVFQNPSGAMYSFSANSQNGINSNAYYNGTNWIYRNSTPASDYFLQNGQHVWRVAPSGTAGNAITFTQAMTLDASGNLGIGTSLPQFKLDLQGTSGLGIRIYETSTGNNNRLQITQSGTVSIYNNTYSTGTGAHAWQIGNVEFMRLDASGNLGLGVTPSAWGSSGPQTALQTQLGALSYRAAGNTDSTVTHNAYYDGTNWKYIASSVGATRYQMTGANAGSTHSWSVSAGGTAGNTISFTQAMTLDASGNLAVGGITSTSAAFSQTTTKTAFSITPSNSDAGGTTITNSFVAGGQGPLIFADASGERARITSGGDLLVGTTSSLGSYRVQVVGANSGIVSQVSSNAESPADLWSTTTTGDNTFARFYTEGGSGTFRGSITYNRAGGLTAYNTTSDYRAKDIIGPVQNSGATIDALKVYEGKMKGATQSRPMLVAHEAQEHTPYAVTGEKDAVNEDGTPKFQQMDVSSLVPLLLAEIQSLRARVAALEAK